MARRNFNIAADSIRHAGHISNKRCYSLYCRIFWFNSGRGKLGYNNLYDSQCDFDSSHRMAGKLHGQGNVFESVYHNIYHWFSNLCTGSKFKRTGYRKTHSGYRRRSYDANISGYFDFKLPLQQKRRGDGVICTCRNGFFNYGTDFRRLYC